MKFHDTIYIKNRMDRGGIWWTHRHEFVGVVEIIRRFARGEEIEQERIEG